MSFVLLAALVIPSHAEDPHYDAWYHAQMQSGLYVRTLSADATYTPQEWCADHDFEYRDQIQYNGVVHFSHVPYQPTVFDAVIRWVFDEIVPLMPLL